MKSRAQRRARPEVEAKARLLDPVRLVRELLAMNVVAALAEVARGAPDEDGIALGLNAGGYCSRAKPAEEAISGLGPFDSAYAIMEFREGRV